jgi:hypothetical protein
MPSLSLTDIERAERDSWGADASTPPGPSRRRWAPVPADTRGVAVAPG